MLTIHVVQIGAGSLASGVVTGRMVDLDATIQPQAGPPGVLVTQAGSVTYDFAPPLSPGTHLGSASISSSNQFNAKGLPTPNGAVSTLKGQVWDWSRSAWVDVSYADSGSTQIPDAAINPTTGEVQLKISSDGTFTSGYLSLTGTVSK